MRKGLLSVWSLKFPVAIIYMLQATEYDVRTYFKWFGRVDDFGQVMHRKSLVRTKAARLLLLAMYIGMLAQAALGTFLLYQTFHRQSSILSSIVAAAFLLSAPVVWAYLVVVPLVLGRWFIVKPLHWLRVLSARKIFANHPGTKIAIAGSYGKTTMKEMLQTVLSEGKRVAATPANRNVAISHAQFAKGLKGDEDVLIIEYGEGAPGDVARFAKNTHPNTGIITGVAAAHLDRYRTVRRAAEDIFSLARYLGGKEVYVNGESEAARPFIRSTYGVFTAKGMGGWKVSGVKSGINGISFELSNSTAKFSLKSRLLGEHQIGPLVLVAVLSHRLGLSKKQIEAGVSKIEPFEHRMRPYQLSGAWIIDDTYNGNIEGMKAGLRLLASLPAKRRIYVTPGLVDQGDQEHSVHVELGRAITKANPDQVVLMKHSVTDAITEGLENYKGQLIIEDDPLEFYNHLDKFVAAGDIVMMQNDWPDNYN